MTHKDSKDADQLSACTRRKFDNGISYTSPYFTKKKRKKKKNEISKRTTNALFRLCAFGTCLTWSVAPLVIDSENTFAYDAPQLFNLIYSYIFIQFSIEQLQWDYISKRNVPQCQKTYLRTNGPSEDSDQPAQLCRPIRIFTGRKCDSQGCKVSSSMRTTQILSRLSGCVGWFETSLGAHVRRKVSSHQGSKYYYYYVIKTEPSGVLDL